MHASGELTRNNDITRRARGYSGTRGYSGPGVSGIGLIYGILDLPAAARLLGLVDLASS